MVNIAIVGYRELMHSPGHKDIVIWVPKVFEGIKGIHFCHIDVIEERGEKDIAHCVEEMLAAKPDVLQYANYRDPYNPIPSDEHYILEVRRQSPVPILITSGGVEGETFAKRMSAAFIPVPFKLEQYVIGVHKAAYGLEVVTPQEKAPYN